MAIDGRTRTRVSFEQLRDFCACIGSKVETRRHRRAASVLIALIALRAPLVTPLGCICAYFEPRQQTTDECKPGRPAARRLVRRQGQSGPGREGRRRQARRVVEKADRRARAAGRREPPPAQKRRRARGRGEPRRRRQKSKCASDAGGHAPLAKSQARCLIPKPREAPQEEGGPGPDADRRPVVNDDCATSSTNKVFLAQNTSAEGQAHELVPKKLGLHFLLSSEGEATTTAQTQTRALQNELRGDDWNDGEARRRPRKRTVGRYAK